MSNTEEANEHRDRLRIIADSDPGFVWTLSKWDRESIKWALLTIDLYEAEMEESREELIRLESNHEDEMRREIGSD